MLKRIDAMRGRTLWVLASMAVVMVVGQGCSSDGDKATVDAGANGGTQDGAVGALSDAAGNGSDAAPPDGGVELMDCTNIRDAVPCGPASVCIDSVCSPSRCGDGIIDTPAGEECDDVNELSGDGCSLCRFECKTAQDCDDGDVCNGSEVCNTDTHVCGQGANAAGGTMCNLDGLGAMGVCRGGACAEPGCGDGKTAGKEACDDGNDNDEDGCTRTCEFTCSSAKDCDNGNVCDGVETCDLTTHTCEAGAAVVCQANGCAGQCNAKSGLCAYPDADKDGASCDTDCSDADPARFPGAFECADGKDNDCNATTPDMGSPGCECYVDSDKDGYAVSVSGAIASPGTCPAGYTRTKPVDVNTADCASGVPTAFPGQSEYFPTGYCRPPRAKAQLIGPIFGCLGEYSWDYNCDGAQTSSGSDGRTAAKSCGALTILNCRSGSGWVDAVPACGGKGTFRTCSLIGKSCTGFDVADRVRPCH